MSDLITVRNDGKTHIVVEINGKEVIREFYVSGESEINHTYHWHDRATLSNHVVIPEGEFAGIVEALDAIATDAIMGPKNCHADISKIAQDALAIAQKYAPEGK